MENESLRKSKILLVSNRKVLKPEYFDNLLKDKNLPFEEKWFLRGCKHITERHYTEAIKRFQLCSTDDARLLLLAAAFKVADKFLFNEYYKSDFNETPYFEKYKITPFFQFEDACYQITPEFISFLKAQL